MGEASQWPDFDGYKPLDRARKEIRLLRILPATEGKALECEIVHQSLDDRPEFCALSYYWGAPGVLATILVDGSEVKIRETLLSFLESLSSRLGSLVLWLDAISINQNDNAERNWQVTLMKEIYQSAQDVYAWLGEGDADCLFAMKYAKQRSLGTDGLPEVSTTEIMQYFEQLFLRPYWSRVWVVQEAALANRLWLLCGTEAISWDDLVPTVDELLVRSPKDRFPHDAERKVDHWDETEPEQQTEAISRFSRFKQARDAGVSEGGTLLELVETFRKQNCSNPRDKLYGLRGIARDGERLRINYDLSTSRVFLEALELNIPTFTWPNRSSWALTKIDRAIALCSSIPMARPDISAMLHDTKSYSVLEWLSRRGTVISCEPATAMTSKDIALEYSTVTVQGRSKELECYSLGQDVRPGDRVYSLMDPGEGDEDETNEPMRTLAFVFRSNGPHSKAIDWLLSWNQMQRLRMFQRSTVDILLREYTGLREAIINRIEICCARSREPLLCNGDYVLAHFSYATLLTLTAWFRSRRIPDYISQFNKSSVGDITLCKCPHDAKINVEPEAGTGALVFSAPWSPNGFF